MLSLQNPTLRRLSASLMQPSNLHSNKAYGWSRSSVIGLVDPFDSALAKRLFHWMAHCAPWNSLGAGVLLRSLPTTLVKYGSHRFPNKTRVELPWGLSRRVEPSGENCVHQWSGSDSVPPGFDPQFRSIFCDGGDSTDLATVDALEDWASHVWVDVRSHEYKGPPIPTWLIGSSESSQNRSGSTISRLTGKTTAGASGNACWKIRSVAWSVIRFSSVWSSWSESRSVPRRSAGIWVEACGIWRTSEDIIHQNKKV